MTKRTNPIVALRAILILAAWSTGQAGDDADQPTPPASLSKLFMLPDAEKDQRGNPVTRRNAAGLIPGWSGAPPKPDPKAKLDETYLLAAPKTRVPYEIWLKKPRMEFVLILPGTFEMGSADGEKDAYEDEWPVHTVNITKPLYLGKYEVTQGQWRETYSTGWFKSAKAAAYIKLDRAHAMSYVSLYGWKKFLQAVSSKKVKLSLPSEAEWEYACRAGTTTHFFYGDDPQHARLGDYAWFRDNTIAADEKYPHMVGRKLPNPWGLYDMYGNVWEGCGDWYDSRFYEISPEDDPRGAKEGSNHALRGGCWASSARACRSPSRERQAPWHGGTLNGFRACLRDF